MAKTTVRSGADVTTRVANGGSSPLSTRVDSANSISLSSVLLQYLDEVGKPSAASIASLDDAERALRQHMDSETASRVMQGWVLASVSEMGNESLRDLATRVAMSHESIRQRIACFHLFLEIPDLPSLRACAHLDFSIIRELAKWPREEAIAFAAGGRVRGVIIGDVMQMTAREFQHAARAPELVAAERKVRDLELDKDGLVAELKGLKDALLHRYDALKIPQFAARARQESVALCEQINLAVTALVDLHTTQLVQSDDARQWPDWAERAAGTMYHGLRAQLAQIQAQLQNMEEHYGQGVTGRIDHDHVLTAGEVLAAKDALSIITKRHKAQAANREAEAHNAKGLRGRPRTIKAVD